LTAPVRSEGLNLYEGKGINARRRLAKGSCTGAKSRFGRRHSAEAAQSPPGSGPPSTHYKPGRAFPVFALDLCIFEKAHYYNVVVPLIQKFKFRHFGHDAIVLHEHSIRKQKPPFTILNKPDDRAAFMKDLNAVMEAAEFTIVAAVIDKQRHASRYADPKNPYDLALLFCIERAYAFLKHRGQHNRQTHVIVEGRGKREDD